MLVVFELAVLHLPKCPANTPPFCNLSLSTKRRGRGGFTRDATFSLAITPSLPVPCPQLCVQIEAIWKDVIYTMYG